MPDTGFTRKTIEIMECNSCHEIDKVENIEYMGKCWHCGNKIVKKDEGRPKNAAKDKIRPVRR